MLALTKISINWIVVQFEFERSIRNYQQVSVSDLFKIRQCTLSVDVNLVISSSVLLLCSGEAERKKKQHLVQMVQFCPD